MRRLIAKYKHSIELAKKKNPERFLPYILWDKITAKIAREYDALRCRFIKDSTFQHAEDLYMCSLFPKGIIDIVLEKFQPKSVLDVGCGTGVALGYFKDNDINVIGIENSRLAIRQSKNADLIIKHNLKKPFDLKRKFDMVWCFEVIEHIHPQFENIFLNSLVSHGDRIVLSAARPGQGGHGHFNEQLPGYWISKFNALGFTLNEEMTNRLQKVKEEHAENILVFQKRISE